MAISLKRAEQHVADWTRKLGKFPIRASWPRHLFHTCQVEVAASVIEDGKIICRNGVSKLICDVANQGALWNNPDAHSFVRLYFRPKNSFHLKTEGIKSASDPYRQNPHMSIPVAFAFDFIEVMTDPTSAFLYGNFAKSGATMLSGDPDFDSLDFDLIYHDAATTVETREEIHNCRMSEVVVRNALDLSKLSSVICRTPHEARTLEHMLRTRGVAAPKILIEQRGGIFFRRGIFLDQVYTVDGALIFKFHPPTVSPQPEYEVKLTKVGEEWSSTLNLKASAWRIRGVDAKPETVWQIEIDGCLAYLGKVPSAPAEGRVVP